MATSTSASSPAATGKAQTGPKAQGGIIEGLNPILYDPKNPINLFIIQAIIIIVFCRLLHYPLSKLAQPRVIAEVLGGIILGPSVMMRIDGFQSNIFPANSLPILNNIANVGLLLFLFLVGLEVDTRMARSHWRVALSVSIAGMLIPFGLGYGVAYGIFKEFPHKADIGFGTFGLFVGTALAITAFPVLCRILTELQLLHTPVGVTALAAGVGNDVVGWVLLALSVALVNNANGLSAFYVFLTAVGWVLFMVFAVRPPFLWLLRRSGSLQNGPSPGIMALTLLMTLVSAFFTAAIGVHPIFGAFLAGLICPHDGGFAIKVTEKIEDLVSVLLLPLYFALSGLNTNLGLLNNGRTWAYVVAIIAIAFVGKVGGGIMAARLNKLLWKESVAIGVLMSCKGLVELIVLNIGLQANILTQQTFTMFVVMALVTTVATSPLVMWVYPPTYRKKVEKWRKGETDWDGNPILSESQSFPEEVKQAVDDMPTSRLLVQLRVDALPGLFNIVSLLGGARSSGDQKSDGTRSQNGAGGKSAAVIRTQDVSLQDGWRPLEVHCVRLVEVTDRTSSIMASAELDEFADQDSVFATFRTFSQLNGAAVAGHVSAVPTSLYADAFVDHVKETKPDMALIPWSSHGSLIEDSSLFSPGEVVSHTGRFLSRTHIDYVQTLLDSAECSVAVLISRAPDLAITTRPSLSRAGTGLSISDSTRNKISLPKAGHNLQRIFFPFIGGRDDRAALKFALRLAQNPRARITVACMSNFIGLDSSDGDSVDATGGKSVVEKPVVHLAKTRNTVGDSEILESAKRVVASRSWEDRVTFVDVHVASAAAIPESVIQLAKQVIRKPQGRVDDIVLLGRRHDSLIIGDNGERSLERDFRRAVGTLGDRFAAANLDGSLLIMQSPRDHCVFLANAGP